MGLFGLEVGRCEVMKGLNVAALCLMGITLRDENEMVMCLEIWRYASKMRSKTVEFDCILIVK